ncbi:MAG: alpha/beta hydrolase [Alphaproteobacteria bacterium]|nr:alpha/beta hydrolase [Alphaproteobacteria bacterium]
MTKVKLEILSKHPSTITLKKIKEQQPILFVHGAFCAAWMWDEHFLSYFAEQGHHAYALSLRGHGGSEDHQSLPWMCMSDYVYDVARTVDDIIAEHGRPPILVGHSMGGMIVQKYMQQSLPNDIPAMILMASVPPGGVMYSASHMAMNETKLFMEVGFLQAFGIDNAPIESMRKAMFSDNIPPEKEKMYYNRMQPESQRVNLDMMMPNMHMNDFKNAPPVLVIGAGNDAFVSESHIIQTQKFFKADYKIFPGSAHAMMLGNDWEKIASFMNEWMKNK